MNNRLIGVAVLATLVLGLNNTAHTHSHQAQAGSSSSATEALKAANDKMHRDMAIAFSGDVHVDFVRGMIPHHQGAIDMAKVVLEHGTDPALRELAEAIIAAQEAEIAMMRAWLKQNAPSTGEETSATQKGPVVEESMPGMGH
jgi:uncharacterized protein (DUF305 family)